MSQFALTGVESSKKAPLQAFELIFGQGPSTAGSGERTAIYTAPQLTTGVGVVNTVYAIGTAGEAASLFGEGSPLHRLLRFHLMANKTSKVYAMPYAASSGAGLISATGTFTITASPTSSGTAIFYVCEEKIEVGFTTSSTATTIGDDLEAKINAKTHLPVTAANVAGVVTMTARIGGASQNGIYRLAFLDDPGTGVTSAKSGATIGTGTGTAGVDGATTENANLVSALAAQEASRYYYKGFSISDGTNLASIETHMAATAQPLPGLRSRAFVGDVSAAATVQAVAVARNYERIEIITQRNSNHDPAQLCANAIAVYQKHENTKPVVSFDYYSGSDWLIQPALLDSDWYTDTEIEDLVTDGVTAVQSSQAGSYIVMAVNTRSKDSTGALDDFRAAEPHRVSALDKLADDFGADFRREFSNHKLMEHPIDAATGLPDANAKIEPGVLTPFTFKPWIATRIRAQLGITLQGDEWLESLETRIDPANKSRMQASMSGRVIDLLHQATFRIAETTPN